jgi:hypothetical protein
MNAEQRLLKSKLEIKRQMKYCQSNLDKVKVDFPENKAAHASWEGIIEGYKISLMILNGEEL